MTPVFDRHSKQVGWFESNNLFSLGLNWIAFYSNGNLFFATNLKWLGSFENGSIHDKFGKTVAWLEGVTPHNKSRPIPPAAPFRPISPIQPRRPIGFPKAHYARVPLGGWSSLSWEEWLGEKTRAVVTGLGF